MKSSIIVTGGAGFIGSCLIAYLNLKNIDDIIIVDNKDTINKNDKFKNISNLYFNEFIDKKKFIYIIKRDDSLFDNVKYIINLGASSDTRNNDIEYLMDNNYKYSKNLAIYSVKKKIKMIHASSAATYGNGINGKFSDKYIELTSLKPLNLYGLSKHLFDIWAYRNNMFLSGLVSIKFFNVFGPNEYHKNKMASIIYKSYQNYINNRPMVIYDLGCQRRDFIYVKDCCYFIYYLMENPSYNGIVNFGSGETISFNGLIKKFYNTINKSYKIKFEKMPDEMKKGYQNYTCADLSFLKTTYKYKNKISLETSLKDYYKYLHQNEYLSSHNF